MTASRGRALTGRPRAINKANDVFDAARDRRRPALGARRWLPSSFLHPRVLLQLPKAAVAGFLRALPKGAPAAGAPLLAPVEPTQEVWAAGVTYLRSRDAREEESAVKDVYTRVYEAKRPELFFKANGWRVAGHDMPIRVRDDSAWNVPEPELALVINSAGEIVGHTVCNDVSSRDIEGDNPLYLPQAKVYNGSCAVGPGIHIGDTDRLKDLTIALEITRAAAGPRSRARRAPRRSSARSRSWPSYLCHGARLPEGRVPVDRHGHRAGPGLLADPRRRRRHHHRRRSTRITTMTLENEVAGKSVGQQRTK